MRFLLTLLLVSFASVSQAATLIFLDSRPGDYIGQGIQRTFVPADGTFTASRNGDGGVSIGFAGGALGTWHLDFATPSSMTFAPGTYENATRFPFQSSTVPGLSVYGAGRGCNTLTGRFVVLEAEFGPTGNVLAFAADFEQHCEGGNSALFGAVRYNSQNVPENLDADGDGVIDVADNCPALGNPLQENSDGDAFGNVCDPFPLDPDNLGACLDALTLNVGPDQDADGEADGSDRCPGTTVSAAIDDAGCSLEQFCAKVDATTTAGKAICKKVDWRNDEPAMKPKERDCRVDKGSSRAPTDDRCVPNLAP